MVNDQGSAYPTLDADAATWEKEPALMQSFLKRPKSSDEAEDIEGTFVLLATEPAKAFEAWNAAISTTP